MPANHDVARSRIERDAVQGRMGLDHATMLLGVQSREHLITWFDEVVEPGRETAETLGQLGGAEHQQSTDHLHPRRAASRSSADDDVAVAKGKTFPASAVLLIRDVPVDNIGHCGILERRCLTPKTGLSRRFAGWVPTRSPRRTSTWASSSGARWR